MLFDAHCHLDAEVFDRGDEGGADAALDRAAAAGVAGVVIAGFDGARRDRTLELARRAGVFAAAGLHPWAVARGGHDAAWVDAQLGALDAFIAAHRQAVCAVGEVGLDFFVAREGAGQALQRRALTGALEIARAHELPVIVHAVRCDEALEEALGAQGEVRGLLHAFSGTPEAARRWAARGWHISLGPPLTWSGAQGRRAREVARQVARARPAALLLETDAPDRPVAGVEGGEPAHVAAVFEGLMAALGVDAQDQAAREGWLARTEASARACFGGLTGRLSARGSG